MNRLVFVILLLASNLTLADKVTSITVFQVESSEVSLDMHPANKHIPVKIFQMDEMHKMDKLINQKLNKRLPSFKSSTPMESYTNAFSDLLNSSEWPAIADGMEAASESVEYAIRYKIDKVPAIVFNDRSIVYGVHSLQEAMLIFNNSQGAK